MKNFYNPDSKTAFPWLAVNEVSELIKQSENKHPGQPWRKETMKSLLNKLEDHLDEIKMEGCNLKDKDTKKLVLAHLTARSLMLLELQIIEEAKTDS